MANEKLGIRSIGVKLTLVFVVLAIVLANFLAFVLVRTANSEIESQAFNQLRTVGQLKSNQIISYLEREFSGLAIISKDLNTTETVKKLTAYQESLNTPNNFFDISTEDYDRLYNEINPYYQSLKYDLKVPDLYIISANHGNVMYTMNKEKDLGVNLESGEYSDTGLAKLWKDIVVHKMNKHMVDFSLHSPINENAAFLGMPVFDEKKEVIAVIAIQLSSNEINEIMNESTGMGETGESYLVGTDFLMRSDSRFSKESSILKQKVNTKSVELALNHQSGQHIIEDYRGVSVLSYYADLELDERFNTDFEWAVVTEMDEAEAFAAKKSLFRKTVLYIIIIVLVVMFVTTLIARYFTRPILKLVQVTKLLAEGDLTQEIVISSTDEIGSLGASFKTMQMKLRTQMDDMNEAVSILASSTSEIMAMISQLAAGSAETATSVSETTTTIEEVKQTAEVSVQKATEVSETAQKISSISQQGKKSVDATIEGMNRIKQQMESIATIVIQLSEKSNTIGEIANNVSDLAEQSNLLAVNASIEAAKAGEQGKGFSVVAQEIKNLANRSKDSTIQIRSILTDIQKEITNTVMATEQGGKVIDAGLELSSTAKEVISMLAAGVEQTSEANIHIAASSQQQLTGMDQITMAMENIKDASHQATEGTMQAEESITELKNLGDRLVNMLKQFKLD